MDHPRSQHTRPPQIPRLLLVEDEEALRTIFVRVLVEAGYAVVDVGDAHTALDRIYTAAQPFDLLVTDNTMPGLSGAALARQIRRVWPALPILCVTGRPPSGDEEPLGAPGMAPVRWLLKPVTPAEFLEAVRSLLAR